MAGEGTPALVRAALTDVHRDIADQGDAALKPLHHLLRQPGLALAGAPGDDHQPVVLQ